MAALLPLIAGLFLARYIPRRAVVVTAEIPLFAIAAAILIITAPDHNQSYTTGLILAAVLAPLCALTVVLGTIWRNHATRTIMTAVVAVVALAGVGSAVGVAARDAQGAVQAGCGPTLVFLVWPHGHPAIPRYSEFPHVPNPHIELYVGLKGYDVTNAGAWIIGGKSPTGITRGGFFTNCANYGDPVTAGTVANAKTITKQTAVKCVVKGSPAVDVEPRAGGVGDLYLHVGKTMIATAHVTANSVKLVVPRNCTLIAAPHA